MNSGENGEGSVSDRAFPDFPSCLQPGPPANVLLYCFSGDWTLLSQECRAAAAATEDELGLEGVSSPKVLVPDPPAVSYSAPH
jgi:hypothetical protein